MKSVTWKQLRWVIPLGAGLLASLAKADTYLQGKIDERVAASAATKEDILRLENKIDHITDILIEVRQKH